MEQIHRIPTVRENMGENLVMENRQKHNVMEIENILEMSWNFSSAYHESCTRSSDNSISNRPAAVIWL